MPYKGSKLLDREPVECPICKKMFIPALEHYWRINYRLAIGNVSERLDEGDLVCSYSCMRVWEKEKGYKRR